MVCLGFEPGAAGWKAQTDPLSYGGTPYFSNSCQKKLQQFLLLFFKKPKSHKIFVTLLRTNVLNALLCSFFYCKLDFGLMVLKTQNF